MRANTSKYDDAITRLAGSISRAIDQWTVRRFYPILEKRYFSAVDGLSLFVGDLFSITTLKTDEDADRTYETTWAATDYDLMPFNAIGSYGHIDITPNGNNAFPMHSPRGVEIDGVWAHSDDRAAAWEDSGQTVVDNPLAAGATSLEVGSIAGDDLYGISPALAAGMLIRLESESCEITKVNEATKITTLIRGVNGTTDAAHVQGVAVEIWRPNEPVKLAANIMAVRAWQRASQGFADARANPELGQLQFVAAMDPEAEALLLPYQRLVMGVV